jgi:hypothetical protein
MISFAEFKGLYVAYPMVVFPMFKLQDNMQELSLGRDRCSPPPSLPSLKFPVRTLCTHSHPAAVTLSEAPLPRRRCPGLASRKIGAAVFRPPRPACLRRWLRVHEWYHRRNQLQAYSQAHNGTLPPRPLWRRWLTCGQDPRYEEYGLEEPVPMKVQQRIEERTGARASAA